MKKDEDSLRAGLDTIERNARLQAQLIDDLLDMSRIVSGKLRIQNEAIDPASVVQAAIASVQPTAFAKGVDIARQLDGVGARVSGDPARLEQVMWNLLTNAVKFTPAQGRGDVRLRTEGPWVEVTVAATGEGIGPGFLRH